MWYIHLSEDDISAVSYSAYRKHVQYPLLIPANLSFSFLSKNKQKNQ